MVSIIIPAFKEPYLNRTIDSLLENSTGEVEIIVIIDGFASEEAVREDPRVKTVVIDHVGMRGATNVGMSMAKGDFLMKSDAHCIYAPGFDKVLSDNCAEDWLVIPRRYSLDETTWTRNENRSVRDYHYISSPKHGAWGYGIFPIDWRRHGLDSIEIDDTMTFQGSCWFANREYFMEHIGPLDDKSYSPFGSEQLEIGLKYWLGGGQNKVVKKTWYAHFRKNLHSYNTFKFSTKHKRDAAATAGHEWAAKHWMNNEEPNMVHKFEWLVEKFWPVPTWPEDRSLWIYP